MKPQSEIHREAVDEMTPLETKLDLVGNLSRSSLYAKTETFNGTWLCQINVAAESTRGTSFVVNK